MASEVRGKCGRDLWVNWYSVGKEKQRMFFFFFFTKNTLQWICFVLSQKLRDNLIHILRVFVTCAEILGRDVIKKKKAYINSSLYKYIPSGRAYRDADERVYLHATIIPRESVTRFYLNERDQERSCYVFLKRFAASPTIVWSYSDGMMIGRAERSLTVAFAGFTSLCRYARSCVGVETTPGGTRRLWKNVTCVTVGLLRG